MRRSATLMLLFLPLIFDVLAPAQEKVSAPLVAAKTEPKPVVVPPGEISVEQLVQVVARTAGRNILCSEDLAGTKPIALTQPVTLDPATCEETLCNLLFTRGLGLVPVDTAHGILEVINVAGPRGREVMAAAVVKTPEQVLAQPESKRAVMTTVRLKHVNAPVMVNMLRPLAGSSGLSIGNVGNNEGLMLRGIQRDVATAVRMIQENDQPPADGPGPGGPAGAPADVAALVARMAALEKQVEQLKQQVAALQKNAGK